jgi:hypothetical protein
MPKYPNEGERPADLAERVAESDSRLPAGKGGRKEMDMAKFSERKVAKGTEKGGQMYPNNGLKQPVRSYSTTFSAVKVLKQMFIIQKANASA